MTASNSLLAGFIFLINTLFDIYLSLLIARVILAYRRSNYATNLITQFIVKLTRPIVQPLKKIIPDVRHIELSTVLIIFLVEMLKWFLILVPIVLPNVLGLVILAVGDSLELTLQVFFYAILLQAILSWVQPYSPVNWFLRDITTPVTRFFQRLIPPIGGLDISPIPALIVLQLLIIVVTHPLVTFGKSIAFGQ